MRGVALLFVVGEERNSAGAFAAAKQPRGSRFLINGEPTENKLALGSKGALRYEIAARGRMAHSAYPHLGESAIEKLLDALDRVRRMQLPRRSVFGASTLNIGTIQGGRAPNVIPDHAIGGIFIRLVDSGDRTRAAIAQAVDGLGGGDGSPVHSRAAFGSAGRIRDHAWSPTPPIFRHSADAWGQPFLFGPGSIHVAHTDEERMPKAELLEAIEIYQKTSEAINSAMSGTNPSWSSGRDRHGGPGICQFSARSSVVRSDLAGRERPLRREAYREATTWRLGGETPAYVRDIVVSESKPGRRSQAGVLRHGRVRRHRNRAGVRGGRAHRRFEFAQSSHGRGCSAAGAGNQRGSSETDSGAAAQRADGRAQIVTNPNCSTIVLVMALAPLKQFGIRRVMVTTMQAISGAGYPGVASMDINANVVPFIGGEEEKMQQETQKILGDFAGNRVEPLAAKVSAHCNRVPVVDGHTIAVSVELEKKPSEAEILRRMAKLARHPAAEGPAQRAALSGDLYGRAGSSAAAPRRGARKRNGRVRRPLAEMPGARLQIRGAGPQHRARRGGSGGAERGTDESRRIWLEPMIVMKFGGTSVESAEAIGRVAGIVRDRLARRPVVVVSAMGKTTNKLLAIAATAVVGRTGRGARATGRSARISLARIGRLGVDERSRTHISISWRNW